VVEWNSYEQYYPSAGHLQNIITLDNAAMDKIEILYSAVSVMYGSEALGGVMQFFTKDPVFAPGGEQARMRMHFCDMHCSDELTGHLDFSMAGRRLVLYQFHLFRIRWTLSRVVTAAMSIPISENGPGMLSIFSWKPILILFIFLIPKPG
jgi:hypothetical protein